MFLLGGLPFSNLFVGADFYIQVINLLLILCMPNIFSLPGLYFPLIYLLQLLLYRRFFKSLCNGIYQYFPLWCVLFCFMFKQPFPTRQGFK